jgi:membrane protein
MSKIIKKIFNFLYKEESLKIIWFSWWIYFYSLIFTGLIVLSMKINHKIVVISLAGILIMYIIVLVLYILIYKPEKLRYKRWLNVFCMRLFADKETKKSKMLRPFYITEIISYMVWGTFLSFYRKLNINEKYYIISSGVKWFIILIILYSIIFFTISVFFYGRKNKDRKLFIKVLFLNIILFYLRIFFIVGILNKGIYF